MVLNLALKGSCHLVSTRYLLDCLTSVVVKFGDKLVVHLEGWDVTRPHVVVSRWPVLVDVFRLLVVAEVG